MLSASGLRIEPLDSQDPPAELPISGGLPLPPRPWEIGRLPIVDDWHDNGRPPALVPSLGGGWLVDLASARHRRSTCPSW